MVVFAVGGTSLCEIIQVFERHTFESVPIYQRMEAIDSYNDFLTGSFGESINFLTLKRPGVAFPYEQRRNSVLFDDDRNRALKQSNGNNQMVLILDPQKNPLCAHEWTGLQPDPLPRSQKGPRLNRTSRQCNGSDGSDFMVIHRLRPIPRPHNSHHAWSR